MCWVAKHFVTDVISVADDCDGLNTGGLERRGVERMWGLGRVLCR